VEIKKLFTPAANMDAGEARAFMEGRGEGAYVLLDVRQPKEYEQEHIPGAKLIPLPELNDSLGKLDPEKPTIVHCAIGGRSRVAAQLLSGQGFKEVYNLKGGIKAWNGQTASGPQELSLDMIRGDESPAEMIRLAYGMEEGLQQLYKTVHSKTQDNLLADFCSRMVDVEERHKKVLFDLQTKVDGPAADLQAFQAAGDQQMMEGGLDMAQFMEANASFLETLPDAVEVVMMLETQALDLYLRFADKSQKAETKEVLFKICGEEKKHLALLGQLLEQSKR
jgi:rhodanese-related sulfurtransferase